MVAELLINVNDANEYNINADGKDLITLNLNSNDILSKKIVGGKLVITTTTGKKINLSNFNNLANIKTSLDDLTSAIILDNGDKNLVTNPVSAYNYVGTSLNDSVDASNGGKAGYYKKVKKGKKYVNQYVAPQGVNINAGAGDDTIIGSAYNDSLTGGDGINRILVDVTKSFGTDTIYLTDGETLELQFLGDDVLNPSFDNIIYSWNEQKDLILYIYKNHLPVDFMTGERQTNGQTLQGTLILKNYFDKNITLKAYDKNGAELDEGDGVTKVEDIIRRELQAYYDYRAEYAGGNTYYGSRFNDRIDASNATEGMTPKKVKVGKKYVTRYVPNGKGVAIYAGDGDDDIIGSAYNDTICGGNGTTIINIDTTRPFGNDTIVLTEGENVIIKLTNITVNYGLEQYQGFFEPYIFTDTKDLVVYVFNDINPYYHSAETFIGTLTVKNYAVADPLGNEGSIRLVNNNGINIVPDLRALIDGSTYEVNSETYNFNTTFSYSGMRFDENINAEDAGPYTYKEKYKVKGKTKTRTVVTDTGVTIDGKEGNDEITGSRYKDTIIGGSGDNTVILKDTFDAQGNSLGFGDDKIILSQNENLTIKIDDAYWVADAPVFDGRDLLIVVRKLTGEKMGSVRLVGFADNDPTLSLQVVDINDAQLYDLKNIDTFNDIVPSKNTYVGSRFDDTINAENTQQIIESYKTKVKNKWVTKTRATGIGATINAGEGDDTITGSRYNDKITGGGGTNRILVDVRNNFGTDTINLTDGETIEIQFLGGENDNPGFENLVYNFEPTGRDFIIIVYGEPLEYDEGGELITEGHTPKGTLILKDYFVKNVTLVGLDKNGAELKDDQEKTLAFTAHREYQNALSNYATFSGGNAYNGSRFDDVIDASGADRYIKTVTTTKKVKGKTVKTTTKTPTDTGVTIDSGRGDDTITGSDWNDTLYGGEGNDIITSGKRNDVLYGGSGDDTFVFYEGDGIDTVYSESGTDTIRFADVDNFNEFVLISDGTNLIVKYGNDRVVLDKYFVNEANSVQNIAIGDGEGEKTKSLTTFIDEYNAGDGVTPREFATLNSNVELTDVNKDYELVATDTNDTITTFNGDDIVYASKGNDTISLGTGNNKLVYNIRDFGSDTINLTEGENLLIDMTALNLAEVNYSYSDNDLVIGTLEGNITLKNFALSNVVENGSVILKLNETPINLNTALLDKFNIYGDFTGSRLNEKIDASGTTGYWETYSYKSGKKTKYAQRWVVSGATIDAGAGDDTIIGSQYNDTICAGTGNNILDYTNLNWGNDIIYSGGGVDTLKCSNYGGFYVIADGNDLILVFDSARNTITLKDYLIDPSHSVQKILTDSETLNFATFLENYRDGKYNSYWLTYLTPRNYGIMGSGEIHAEEGNNDIFGSDENDTIYGNSGVDYIRVPGGSNTIYSYGGDDIVRINSSYDSYNYIETGDGNDEVQLFGGGNGIIYGGNGNDNITADFINSELSLAGQIYGEDGDDNIDCWGSCEIYGGAGNDIINFGCRYDILIDGGDGDDTYRMDGIVLGGLDKYNNTIVASSGNDVIELVSYNYLTHTAFNDNSITYTRNENDLVINYPYYNYFDTYYMNIILQDYYSNPDSFDKFRIHTMQGNYQYDTPRISGIYTISQFLEELDGSNPFAANGTSSDDIIRSTDSTINGYEGNDIILSLGVENGTQTINTGSGDNTVILSKLNENTSYNTVINGGTGNDKYDFQNNQNNVEIVDNGGNNIICIENEADYGYDSTYTITLNGDGDNIIYTTYKNGYSNKYVINATGSGKQTIDILSDYDSVITTGSGDDNIVVQAGTVNAGDGDDIITVQDRAYFTKTLNGEGGNDTYLIPTWIDSSLLSGITRINDTQGTNKIIYSSSAATHDSLAIILDVTSQGNLTTDHMGCNAVITNNESITYNRSHGAIKAKYDSEDYLKVNGIDTMERIEAYDGYYISSSTISTLMQEAASWLTSDGRNYTSVGQAICDINKGQENLSAIVALFNNENTWTCGT